METNRRRTHDRQIRRCARALGEDGVSALGPLFDLTARRLVRFATTLTRNQEDAEDALQTALLRIAAKPLLLAEATYPWAYLLRVVRNEALNILRRRRPHAELSTAGEPSVPAARTLEDRDAHRRVQQAIDRLPTNQAEVVVLKIWEEMTFQEIAEVLEESPHTVASRYRYALQKLTRHLQPLADEVLHP